MGNRAGQPTTTTRVCVQQQRRGHATAPREIGGFVKEMEYALEFALRGSAPTVCDLLELVNAYREDRITRVQHKDGRSMAGGDVLADGDTVYIV